MCASCDILIPAAVEGVINADMAEGLQARLIVEAANGPCTFDADGVLRRRGIPVIPDLYANAGGVVASYFEWVKNLGHMPFGLLERRYHQKGHRTLTSTIERAVGSVYRQGGGRSSVVRMWHAMRVRPETLPTRGRSLNAPQRSHRGREFGLCACQFYAATLGTA